MEYPFVKNIVAEVLQKEKIYNYELIISSGFVRGNGYTSDILRVEAKGFNDKKEPVTQFFIVKTTLQSAQEIRDVSKLIFLSEIRFYSRIFPAFEAFQRKKTLKKPFDCIPKYYHGLTTEEEQAIVFEDLTKSGFKTWDRKIPLREDYMETTLREYGRFHALSFAMRDQDLEEFQRVVEGAEEPFKGDLDAFWKMWDGLYEKAVEMVAEFGYNDVADKFRNCVNNYKTIFAGVTDLDDPQSVVIHGDNWCGNMMYKADADLKIEEMKFIDFQVHSLGSPATDVVKFFFQNGTGKVLWDFHRYMKLYYDSFATFLRELGSDPEKLFPEIEFWKHVKKYGKLGLLWGTLTTKVFLMEDDEVPTLSAEDNRKYSADIKNYDEFERRIKDIVFVSAKEDLM